MKKVNPADIVGLAEIAEVADVSTQAVVNWTKRHPKFPKPIRVLRSGSLYLLAEVNAWLKETKRIEA